VFYSIFGAVSGNDGVLRVKSSKRTTDTSTISENKYTLLLNYSDPFLKQRNTSFVVRKESGASSPRPTKHAVEKFDQKKADLAKANEATMLFCKSVSFAGSIRNNATKKNIAILTIENKEYMMAVGESVAGITLLKIVSDSVEVKCIDRKMYIKKGA